jgi:hypothetical protein
MILAVQYVETMHIRSLSGQIGVVVARKGNKMRYMLVIYGKDEDWTLRSEAELAPSMAAHESFADDLRKTGKFVAAEALRPSSTVTTIRLKDGEPLLTDGPYIESKEQVAGFYLIDVADLDEALEWGKRLARFEENAVAVWPAIDMD